MALALIEFFIFKPKDSEIKILPIFSEMSTTKSTWICIIIKVRPRVFDDICFHSGIENGDRQAIMETHSVLTDVRTSTSYTAMWYDRYFPKKAKRKFRIEELGKRVHPLLMKQSLENLLRSPFYVISAFRPSCFVSILWRDTLLIFEEETKNPTILVVNMFQVGIKQQIRIFFVLGNRISL